MPTVGAAFFIVLFLPFSLWAKDEWQAATPQELAGTRSTLEPEAPVEALIWRIEVDDHEYPYRREVEEYVRYKIFDPEKADQVLRLTEGVSAISGMKIRTVELTARLTLPDGTVREFNADAVRERDVAKRATADSFISRMVAGDDGLVVKEKFLAIGGAVPGAILEYRKKITDRSTYYTNFFHLQFDSIPVRSVVYHQRLAPSDTKLVHNIFALNPVHDLVVTPAKDGRSVTLTAHEIGSLREEPFSGPRADRAVTVVDCYLPGTYYSPKDRSGARTSRHFGPDEPWAPIAIVENWYFTDHIEQTGKVKKMAADLMASPGSDLEKARRIHDYVQSLHQQFVRAPASNAPGLQHSEYFITPDEVMKYAAIHPPWMESPDFLFLAVSLYRAAGFTAEILMGPDRSAARFDRNLVSPAFLPERCAALQIGGTWHFSAPNRAVPLAFDELPWEFEGLEGLLALDQKQQFLPIPFGTPEQSETRRTGAFRLDENGTLTGDGVMAFRGHDAHLVRMRLNGKTVEKQRELMHETLKQEFEGAEVELSGLRHVDDPYEALEVGFKLNWPGVGVVSDQRMIFRPFVYGALRSPFADAERRNHIIFDFRRSERDELTIALPPGFAPEANTAPASFPGSRMSYGVRLALDAKNMILHVSRELVTGLIVVPPKDYPALKRWYDAVALSDQYNLVLTSAPAAVLPAPPAPPSGGQP